MKLSASLKPPLLASVLRARIARMVSRITVIMSKMAICALEAATGMAERNVAAGGGRGAEAETIRARSGTGMSSARGCPLPWKAVGVLI